MKKLTKRNIIEILVGICIVIILVVVYLNVVRIQSEEAEAKVVKLSTTETVTEDYVNIKIRLVSIDSAEGQFAARLRFYPHGKYLSKDGVNVAVPIVVELNSEAGNVEYVTDEGRRMNPTEAKLVMEGGKAADYPFDTYEVKFAVAMAEILNIEEARAFNKEGEENYVNLPLAIECVGAINGFKIEATEIPDNEIGVARILFKISRAGNVIFFACFIMVVMWLIAIGALFVTLSVLLHGRKVTMGTFTWMVALIFALPSFRSAMPDNPAIGSLIDSMSFFWAEGIVALCLVAMLFTWLLRPAAD